jgi:hypothetical protein
MSNKAIALPHELIVAIQHSNLWDRRELLIVQEQLEALLNGLSTHWDKPPDSLLHAEYARNKWLLAFELRIWEEKMVIKVPGISWIDGYAIVFLSRESLLYAPEMQRFLDEYAPDSTPWSSYRLFSVPDDIDDLKRGEFLLLMSKEYSRSATSPLKQDIVPVLLQRKLLQSESPQDIRSRWVSRNTQRRYRIWMLRDSSNWTEEFQKKHKIRYSELITELYGITPEEVDLTLSWLSANSAVIRYVQSQVSPSNIAVSPWYFFLNEGDFKKWITTHVSESTQAFFVSIEWSYAGLGSNEEYTKTLVRNLEKLKSNAIANPEKTYYISIDATANLAGNALVSACLATLREILNITIFLSSSITKYNRSEKNYHFGMIARLGWSREDQGVMKKFIATSHGSLSPLWVLQFPRLKAGEINNTKKYCSQNHSIFMQAFIEVLQKNGILDMIIIEDYSAYSYIFPNIEEEKRNTVVSALLQLNDLQGIIGSSFYHEEVRLCDVPDIACSAFRDTDIPYCYKNALRISWPNELQENQMKALWKYLAEAITQAI